MSYHKEQNFSLNHCFYLTLESPQSSFRAFPQNSEKLLLSHFMACRTPERAKDAFNGSARPISVKGHHFPKMNPCLENISHFLIESNQTKEKHILGSKFSNVSDHKAGFLQSKIIPSRKPKYSLKLQKRSIPVLPVMSLNCDHLFSFQSHTLCWTMKAKIHLKY